MNSGEQDADLLYGIPRIAKHLGLSDRQARHLAETGAVPTFKLPPGNKIICARRSTLNAWLAEREAAGREGKAND